MKNFPAFFLVLIFAFSAFASNSLVVNSGFESPQTSSQTSCTADQLGWVRLTPSGTVPFDGGVIASGYNGTVSSPDGSQHGYFIVEDDDGSTAADVISLMQTLGNSEIGKTYKLDFQYAHAHSTYKNTVSATVYIDGVDILYASSDISQPSNVWATASSADGEALYGASHGYVTEYTAMTDQPIYIYLRFTNRKTGDAETFMDSVNLYKVEDSQMPIHAKYYVATDGDDVSGDGSISNPWASFAKAKSMVRADIQSGLTGNVFVYFRDGTYYLDQTLDFSELDSGTSEWKIIYTSYPGEYAVISGGSELTGWSQQPDGKWSVTIPQVSSGQWWFRQLWMNDQRCIRSRWPNLGQLEWISSVSADLKDITFNIAYFPGSDLAQSKTEFISYSQWSVGKALIQSRLSNYTLRTQTVAGSVGFRQTEPKRLDMAHLEHNLDYIDAPTEWYLDRATGKLTFLAPEGINPNNQQMIASKIQRLIKIEGSSSSPVKNIKFKGLGFAHTYMPLPDGGYGGLQAGHFGPQYASGPHYILPSAIEMQYAEKIWFDKCNIANMGTGGIAAGIGTKDITVENSSIYDLGSHGVMTGWRGDWDWQIRNCGINLFSTDWANIDYRPQFCVIKNNYIYDIAVEYPGAVAIWDGFTLGTVISGNFITDVPYSGINLGFRWDVNPSSYQEPVAKNNHVSEFLRTLNDGGGIYHLGNSNGGIIKDNVVHDSLDGPKGTLKNSTNEGYYFDQGSTNVTLEHNAAWNIISECVYISANAGTVTDAGDNLCEPSPLPYDMIAAAGPTPFVEDFNAVVSEDCDYVLVTARMPAWAKISYLKCIETDQSIEHFALLLPNGEMIAYVPANLLKTGLNTFEMQIYTPDDKYGSIITRQVNLLKQTVCDDMVDFLDIAALADEWLADGQPYLSGLTGYWNFDGTNPATALDNSGNANHAAINGAVRVSGIGRYAMEFDGSTNITLPSSAFNSINNELTLAFWQKGSAVLPLQTSVLGAIDSSGNRILNIHLPWENETVFWDAGSSSGYDRTQKKATATEYKQYWNHWVFMKNASTGMMKVYLNGQLWHQESGMSQPISTINSATVGSYTGGGMAYYGIIDELRIYNRELSSSEVNILYNYGDLYTNLPLNDLTGDFSVSFDDLLELVENWLTSVN